MRLCIVSPHIDDAILSCGVRMMRAASRGDEVLSLNVFSAGTNDINRQKEELAASATIGAQPFFLNELDAPDRDARYKSDIEIFFGNFANVAPSFIDHVAKRITDFFVEHKIEHAFFPLGGGTHIDHRIVHAAGRQIKDHDIWFYEDRPYTLWPGVLKGRMNNLGFDADIPAVSPEAMTGYLANFDHLKYFVPKGVYRDTCLPRYLADAQMDNAKTHKVQAQEIIATDDDVQNLYKALCCYESQVPLFHPTLEGFVRDNQTYEMFNSGRSVYAERSWRLMA